MLLVRLGTLSIESSEILPEILVSEHLPNEGSTASYESKTSLNAQSIATYDKIDIKLGGTQILYYNKQLRMKGGIIDSFAAEVAFERCLAQTTVETPGMRIAVRLLNTVINISPAAFRAVAAALECIRQYHAVLKFGMKIELADVVRHEISNRS